MSALLVGVVSGVLTGAGGVVAFIRLRRIEEPTSKAAIEKVRAETRATEVETLRLALEAVGAERAQAYDRITRLNDTVTHQGDQLAHTQGELADLREEFRRRVGEVRQLLADHGQWDRQALAALPEGFPPPPPLVIDLDH